MELFEDKLFIFGGYDEGNACNTVMMYNLVTKEWKMMTPLPYAIDEMATVLWQNNVIVLGGRGKGDTVVMYSLTTGESKYLPPMKHRRQGCAAVVTGDVLVVMGGRDGTNYLKSVEAFHLQNQVWEELPNLNEARMYASAVVKPN
jgi:kelch-like protein 1/4/5